MLAPLLAFFDLHTTTMVPCLWSIVTKRAQLGSTLEDMVWDVDALEQGSEHETADTADTAASDQRHEHEPFLNVIIRYNLYRVCSIHLEREQLNEEHD